ncbi:uncharacterized protein [Ptychodera flava]|uniref:uncharacterized protein n=1 Tax=Ptychodera flava TaxID=63121 RepID=UPI00396A2FE2
MEARRSTVAATSSPSLSTTTASFVKAHGSTTPGEPSTGGRNTNAAAPVAATLNAAAPPPVQKTGDANIAGTANTGDGHVAQAQVSEKLEILLKKVEKIEESAGVASVDDALQKVMEMAHCAAVVSRPQLINALRVLVDRATMVGHPKLQRYRAVLSQFEANDFGVDAGRLIILLLGNKEQEEIASKVSKFLKNSGHSTRYVPYSFGGSASGRRSKKNYKCFQCESLDTLQGIVEMRRM